MLAQAARGLRSILPRHTVYAARGLSSSAGESYDYVVVGGGVVGSSVAYHLATRLPPSARIAVLEKDDTYQFASTVLSAGGIRQQFSTAACVAMSMYSIRFLDNIHDHLAVDGELPDVCFRRGGYLFLASEAGLVNLQVNHQIQLQQGANVSLLDTTELKGTFPWLNTDGLAMGSYGAQAEGWIDPYSLLMAFRKKARSLGVTYISGEVTGLTRNDNGNRIESVQLKGGETLCAGTVINASGPWAGHVASKAGVELPVRPRKRMVFVFDCKDKSINNCPLLVDPSGVYVRPESSGSFICGVSPSAEEDFDATDFDIDYDFFYERIWPVLAERVPSFEAIKLTNAWAGHYEFNTFDQNAIIGPHPELTNLIFANGFSGHGLQHAPSVGNGLAELLVDGQYKTIDLSVFGYQRIADNKPIVELAVV